MTIHRMRSIGSGDSLRTALKNGGIPVWLSCIVMGLGNWIAGQYAVGSLFFAAEAGVLAFLLIPGGGFYYLSLLPSLGWQVQEEIFNEELGVYQYAAGHNSQLILLYGVATVFLIAGFILLWRASVRSGYRALCRKKSGARPDTFFQGVRSLSDRNAHKLLMFLPFFSLVIFTILPIVYMMCMAFTNYSKEGNHLILFDWVGLQNFRALLNPRAAIGKQFAGVLSWTLIWAAVATFSNFFVGTLIALLIGIRWIRFKGVWRSILSMTIAVPQFVSLMVIRSMVQPEGIVNQMLRNAGLISDRLPFLTNAMWARTLVIIVNLWVGVPYTVLQVTGILQNIPTEQYEAAKLDGANVLQVFFKITLPYMLFVLTPYLITQFTTNINNFNIIYLLTRGEPVGVGNTAGATDLLVTWLYKLSVDQQKYNIGAVIGIFSFVVLAVVSLLTYRSSNAYRNEEGFR